jgi:plasmid stability protein
MPKTIQIRDVDDGIYAALRRQAAFVGMSVPEYLHREVCRLAARPSPEEWLARVGTRIRSGITTEEVIADLDVMRGPWPGADR